MVVLWAAAAAAAAAARKKRRKRTAYKEPASAAAATAAALVNVAKLRSSVERKCSLGVLASQARKSDSLQDAVAQAVAAAAEAANLLRVPAAATEATAATTRRPSLLQKQHSPTP